MLAYAMCGGVLESGAAVALAAASFIGAEVYNRARLAAYRHNSQAARLARIVRADKLAASSRSNPPAAGRPARGTGRQLAELAAELSAS